MQLRRVDHGTAATVTSTLTSALAVLFLVAACTGDLQVAATPTVPPTTSPPTTTSTPTTTTSTPTTPSTTP
ncbi:MAG: hypothetical protein AAB131_03275, partial [Actinomycetota bacterium]